MRFLNTIVLTAVLTGAASIHAAEPATMPGTAPLAMTGDLSLQMHQAALRDMDAAIADSLPNRARFWKRDTSSAEAYAQSVAENRRRFLQIIGVVDPRVPVTMERFGDDINPAIVADPSEYRVSQVRWPVLPGIYGEGLLLEPYAPARGVVVALPDADDTPEQLAGLAPGIAKESQMARQFVENGFIVIVPTLLDRSSAGSGDPTLLMTNLPHREWIQRQAFTMGRHIIGYEVQKVLAVVDWAAQQHAALKVGVAGYGEGGLIAFHAAAADPRISGALVSGYFKSRQNTWQEPLYRDVWGLLREFGDAEIASLIAPRALTIVYRDEPIVDGPPAPRPGEKNTAAPGRLTTPSFSDVEAEFARFRALVPEEFQLRDLVRGDGVEGYSAFALALGADTWITPDSEPAEDQRPGFNPVARQLRQVRELNDHIQLLVRNSDRVRDAFFLHKAVPEFTQIPWNYEKAFPPRDPAPFVKAEDEYRRIFWEEILGKLDAPLPALHPRTRLAYDRPTWTGYDVVLDTGGEGFAWGVVLMPKGIKAGEKRPVVVCQHGRHGLPSETLEGDKTSYRNFAARLAEEGFIVLAPHNLYQKEENYRMLARKGHLVKATHWSVILRHHQQWLAWLATLPQVDAQRIGFYGLSFGGEAAMRLPTLLPGYALSICSGDFNDWTRKLASTHDRKSFMFTDEWEIACFNMGNTFSYAELSYLMLPRPFMVERGHHDGVALDPWVASEYAKTRWFYDQFGLGDKTAIEFFNGGHTINGEGTFQFLRQHLNWPAAAVVR